MIHFDKDRMAAVMAAHEAWWDGKLDRPLVKICITDAYPAEKDPPVPLISQANCHDFSIPVDALLDTIELSLSRREFLGDAFPFFNFDCFGPGIVAAFCGARLDNSSGRVWFFPQSGMEDAPISEVHAFYDPENAWARRIKEIYRAAVDRFDGTVIMGMPDLGGVMDIVASLRGTENLLYDLIDEPEEVHRLVHEAELAWEAAYDDFSRVLAPQKALTDWDGLLSASPSYVIQCDFCYMISNPMFREFVLPTLKRNTERLAHTIYHLDGIGALTHLDDILTLPKLNAVQWVYGDGRPKSKHWIDTVYRKIAAAGKGIHVVEEPQNLLDVCEALGSGKGLYASYNLKKQDAPLIEELLALR